MSVTGILAAEDAWKAAEAAAMAGTWEGEKRIVSKYVYSSFSNYKSFVSRNGLVRGSFQCKAILLI